eukprot:403372365
MKASQVKFAIRQIITIQGCKLRQASKVNTSYKSTTQNNRNFYANNNDSRPNLNSSMGQHNSQNLARQLNSMCPPSSQQMTALFNQVNQQDCQKFQGAPQLKFDQHNIINNNQSQQYPKTVQEVKLQSQSNQLTQLGDNKFLIPLAENNFQNNNNQNHHLQVSRSNLANPKTSNSSNNLQFNLNQQLNNNEHNMRHLKSKSRQDFQIGNAMKTDISSEEESKNSSINSPTEYKDPLQEMKKLAEKLQFGLFTLPFGQKFQDPNENIGLPVHTNPGSTSFVPSTKQFQDLTPVKNQDLSDGQNFSKVDLKSIKTQLILDEQVSDDSTFPSDSAKSDTETNDSNSKTGLQTLFNSTPEIISQSSRTKKVINDFDMNENQEIDHNKIISQLFGGFVNNSQPTKHTPISHKNQVNPGKIYEGLQPAQNQRWSNVQTKFYEKSKIFIAPKCSEIPMPL